MKFKIKDENGKEFEVEEVAEQDEGCGGEPGKKPEDVHDDEGSALTPEEIASLKELAAMAPALKKLLEVEEKEHAATSEGEQHDEEPDADEAKEEVIDTDPEEEPGKVKDSISKAAGKVEKKQVSDSNNMDACLEVEDAWTKRFNGGVK